MGAAHSAERDWEFQDMTQCCLPEEREQHIMRAATSRRFTHGPRGKLGAAYPQEPNRHRTGFNSNYRSLSAIPGQEASVLTLDPVTGRPGAFNSRGPVTVAPHFRRNTSAVITDPRKESHSSTKNIDIRKPIQAAQGQRVYLVHDTPMSAIEVIGTRARMSSVGANGKDQDQSCPTTPVPVENMKRDEGHKTGSQPLVALWHNPFKADLQTTSPRLESHSATTSEGTLKLSNSSDLSPTYSIIKDSESMECSRRKPVLVVPVWEPARYKLPGVTEIPASIAYPDVKSEESRSIAGAGPANHSFLQCIPMVQS